MRQPARTAVLLLCLTLAAHSESTESYSGLEDDDYGKDNHQEGSSTEGSSQVGVQSPGSSAAAYQEALAKARRGETDQQVLEVFYSAYAEAKRGYDRQLVSERATNLAALLVDMANKIGDADTWMAMYREAEKLSEEVLKVHPADETAQANAMAARNSMQLRSNGMGRAMPERAEIGARSFYDDQEDEEHLRDQEGEDDEDDEDAEDAPPLAEQWQFHVAR